MWATRARRAACVACAIRIGNLLEQAMRILMIVTSWDRLGNSGKRTGLWLEELAAPYHEFKTQGFQVDLTSPQGGAAPLDPRSLTSLSALITTYIRERELNKKIHNTIS